VTPSDEDKADALFHALSDRTRRDILRRVLAGEHSITTLAASYDMSFAAVQKHVAVLERAGLLTKRRTVASSWPAATWWRSAPSPRCSTSSRTSGGDASPASTTY
jgi:predicted ArsR family transcriptional regulator